MERTITDTMRQDRPSFTAQRVAVQRAQLDRPSGPDGDPEAERRLYEGLGNPFLFARLDPGRMRGRTEWFDDATVNALARGVAQVVIVGAGYDGRALRFKGEGVRWIEVDHPATQADKRRRVESLGVDVRHITFAAVDLVHDDVDVALDRAGHQPSAATLYLCEGLLGYLPVDTIVALFSVLRRRSTPDSTLATNFRVTSQPRWLGDHVARGVLDGILKMVGETRLTEFHDGDPERLLAASGWAVERQVIADCTRLDGGSYGLLVLASPRPSDELP